MPAGLLAAITHGRALINRYFVYWWGEWAGGGYLVYGPDKVSSRAGCMGAPGGGRWTGEEVCV